jgi:hypothetical protein
VRLEGLSKFKNPLVGGMGWLDPTQEMDEWMALSNSVINLGVP